MKYQSFKNRILDVKKPVQVYKNLHNGMLSIKQNGLVVAHVHNIILYNVTCKVSQSGRQRVLQEKRKNVHAFIVGYVKHIEAGSDLIGDSHSQQHSRFSYNPYKFNFFYTTKDNSPAIFKPSQLILVDNEKGCFVLDSLK